MMSHIPQSLLHTMMLTFLFSVSMTSHAGGADPCSDSVLSLNNYDDVSCHNLPVLDPGNDNANSLYLLLADKGLLTFKPTQDKTAYHWQYNPLIVPFYDNELGYTAINLHPQFRDKKHKDSYAHERCVTMDSGSRAFIHQVNASRIGHLEKQRLITLRKSLQSQCSDTKTTTNAMADKPDWSTDAVLFAVYLKGIRHFYNNQYDEAKRYFDILTNKKHAWLAETATYMLIRNALGQAYDSGQDSMGFVRIDKIKPKYAQALQHAISHYLKRYPKGLYARSARGFLRRAHWFAGNQRGLINEINWQLAHPNSHLYNLDATNLPAEIVRRVFASKHFDKNNLNSALLLATHDLMRMRHIIQYDYEKNTQSLQPKITLATLKQQQPYFKNEPKLYDYLLASYYYYVAQKPQQALAFLPKINQINQLAQQNQPLSYTDFSRYVLVGRVFEALKQPKKAKMLWQALAKLPHQPYQGELAQLALAIHLSVPNKLAKTDSQAIFKPDSLVTNTAIRQSVIANKADDKTLHYIINAGHTQTTEKQLAIYALLKNNLKQANYGKLHKNLRLLKKPYVTLKKPDDDLSTSPPFAEFTISIPRIANYRCHNLAKTAKQLHQGQFIRKNKACLAQFLQKTLILTYDSYDNRNQASGLPSYFKQATLDDTRKTKVIRHQLYQDVLANRKKDNLRAFALYKLINCYRSSGYNHCGGKDVKKSIRKSWFKQLKRDFPNTVWAKKQMYYW